MRQLLDRCQGLGYNERQGDRMIEALHLVIDIMLWFTVSAVILAFGVFVWTAGVMVIDILTFPGPTDYL